MSIYDIMQRARRIAYKHYFCNIHTDSWPTNPEEILQKASLAGKRAKDLLELPNGESMAVWEPFEDWLACDIKELIDDLTREIIAELKEDLAA